uniref:Uncharacterized protein n=1 Tax=Peronospora matthiolae TaxID=2874970 RepID=A0AAV1U585_9STRA
MNSIPLIEEVLDVVKVYVNAAIEAAVTEIVDDGRSAIQGDLLTAIKFDDSISPNLAYPSALARLAALITSDFSARS